MSRINPNLKNPAQMFFKWSGGATVKTLVDANGNETEKVTGGKVTFWDKDTEQNITVPFPITFLVLDEFHTLTGFNDATQQGYFSNEVRDLKQEIIARNKNGIVARGTYAHIKAQSINGLKYAKSVYGAYKDDEGELVICNFKFAGAALTAWIELSKKVDVEKCAVVLKGVDGPYTKGTTKYFMPKFAVANVSAETEKQAQELGTILENYIDSYMKRKPVENEESIYSENTEEENDIHNIAGLDKPAKKEVEIETLDDGTDVSEPEVKSIEKKSKPQKPSTDGLPPIEDVEF